MEDFFDKFLTFCESKPPKEEYNAGDGVKCALGQFGMKSVGLIDCEVRDIPQDLYITIVYGGDSNFGALVKRLKEWRNL